MILPLLAVAGLAVSLAAVAVVLQRFVLRTADGRAHPESP